MFRSQTYFISFRTFKKKEGENFEKIGKTPDFFKCAIQNVNAFWSILVKNEDYFIFLMVFKKI